MAASKFRYSYNFWGSEEKENKDSKLEQTSILIKMKPDEQDSSTPSVDLPPVEMEPISEQILEQKEPEAESISRPRRFFGPTTQIFKSVLWGGSRMFVRSKTPSKVDSANENLEPRLSSGSSSSGIETDNEEKNESPFPEVVDLESPTSVESVKTYAKLLQQENSRLRQFVEEVLPASDTDNKDSENLKQELITIYGSTIADLQSQINHLHQLFEDVEQNHRREQNELIKECEQKIQDSQRQHQLDLAQVVKDNQQLIDDILNSYFDEIHVWRLEFERETKMTLSQDDKMVVDMDVVDTSNGRDKVALQLIVKFRELQPITQGLVVAGIGIIGLVFGYYSWPFISWAWPRLLAFAARIEAAEVLQVLTWLSIFIQSAAFKEFQNAWEEGKPLTPILIQNFGSDVFSRILQLAPSLFKINRLPTTI